MDELQMVRELFRTPAPPSPAVKAAARARLTGPVRPPRRAVSNRWLVRAGVPVTAAAAAAAVAVTMLPQAAPHPAPHPVPGGRSRPASGVFQLPAGAVPAAAGGHSGRQMLLTAAIRVAQAPQQSVGRYWAAPGMVGNFLRVGPAGHRYVILEKVGVQEWTAQSAKLPSPSIEQPLGVQFASAADAKAWRADGSPSSWPGIGQDTSLASPQGFADGFLRPIEIAPGEPSTTDVAYGSAGFYVFGHQMSAAQLLGLPTDPATVKALLVRQYRADGQPGSLDSYLISAVPQLMTLPVTPAFRSALYQVLADLPGVRSLGPMLDVAGQRGIAVAVDGHWTGCGTETVLTGGMREGRTFSSCDVQQILIIDPMTGLPVAAELRYTGLPAGQSWPAPAGLFSYEIFGAARWTNADPPVR